MMYNVKKVLLFYILLKYTKCYIIIIIIIPVREGRGDGLVLGVGEYAVVEAAAVGHDLPAAHPAVGAVLPQAVVGEPLEVVHHCHFGCFSECKMGKFGLPDSRA